MEAESVLCDVLEAESALAGRQAATEQAVVQL